MSQPPLPGFEHYPAHVPPSLNEQQFPRPSPREEQLTMFMETKDIVDNVHKIDSPYNPRNYHYDDRSPREQWEDPEPFNADDYDDDFDHDNPSLRDQKLEDVTPAFERHVKEGRAKPLAIFSEGPHEERTLADGHHRLAVYEQLGRPLVPVTWRERPVWGSSARRW